MESTSGPGRPGGYAKGRARRDDIIAQASEHFAEVGYWRASLREIAARSGITHAGLLHHFATKADLFAEVFAHDDAQALRADPLAMPADQAMRGWVDLIAANAMIAGRVELHAHVSVEATNPEHPAHARMRERYETLRELGRAVVERAAADGLVRDGIDPASAATRMLALMDGLQLQWLYHPADIDMPAQIRAQVQEWVTFEL